MRVTVMALAVRAACDEIGQDWRERKQREAWERVGPIGRRVMAENAKMRLASLAGAPLPPANVPFTERQVPT